MPVCHPAEHACSTGSWRHSLGASSFDNSYTRTQGVVCHCGACQNTSKPLPAHVLLVPETHRGERFKEQGNQAWPGLTTEPCRLHPFASLAILVPCPRPCLACLHCTAQPPLLCWRLQPPQLNPRLGSPAPPRKRISVVPDNTHCKKLTLLQ